VVQVFSLRAALVGLEGQVKVWVLHLHLLRVVLVVVLLLLPQQVLLYKCRLQ
jgi:hypothetical protein